MFDIESAFVDVAAIEAGKWIELGADFPGAEIRAKGMSSTEAKTYYDKLRREAPRTDRLANGQLSDTAQERILRDVILEKCLLDWRGFASGGKPLPFSRQTAEMFLTEPKARKLGTAIVNAIVAIDDTRAARDEEIAGN